MYLFGAQRTDQLRAAADFEGSSTNEAAAARAPINLPSWDHIGQPCDPYRSIRGSCSVATEKADHSDAYKHSPLAGEGELPVVVSARNPDDQLLYALIPRTQLFDAAAAGLHYNGLSRVLATRACRWLKFLMCGILRRLGHRVSRAASFRST